MSRRPPPHYHFWVLTTELAAPEYVKSVRSFQAFRHRVQAVRASKRINPAKVLGISTGVCYDSKCPSPESGERGSLGF